MSAQLQRPCIYSDCFVAGALNLLSDFLARVAAVPADCDAEPDTISASGLLVLVYCRCATMQV